MRGESHMDIPWLQSPLFGGRTVRQRTGPSTVPAAPPVKYVLGYRSRTLTLNPNPIIDPNPNPENNKKVNDTGMKLNIELYLKVDFLGTGWVYNRSITGNGTQTHGRSQLSRSRRTLPLLNQNHLPHSPQQPVSNDDTGGRPSVSPLCWSCH